ncbi:MAG: beta-ketoacyl-[acyl-carrier-protein] synthase family protein [Salegentibacter sp.]
MNKGVAVTGMGVISSIGNNVGENYGSLVAGKSGISFPEVLDTVHRNLPVAEIKISNEDLAEKLQLPAKHSFTRAALLGTLAAQEALLQGGFSKAPEGTGFISGTSVGGIDATEKYFFDYPEHEENRRFIPAQHPGFTTEKIAEQIGISGFVTTLSTACSSAANAIMLGARMIKSGQLKRVIVGGTDCLTKFTLNGFHSLLLVSEEANKPFDENRHGLNLGEAAAYLVLEADEVLEGKPVLGRLSGYGNANDAFHQTASSENGEGAFLAMQKSLKIAGLQPKDIDYINAHGTATKNNDLAESRALQRIFSENLPDFSSTKSFTGHTLGAAGAVEAVFSLLAIQQGNIFPNLNFSDPMKETGLRPVTFLEQKDVKHVLSNSFGFGGNCTSLIFSRNEE